MRTVTVPTQVTGNLRVVAAERMDLDPTVLAAGSLVVAASTVAHGLTVTLGRRLYRRYHG